MQLKALLWFAILILLVTILDDAFHGRAFVRQAEHGFALCVEQLDFLGLVLKVEVSDLFLLKRVLEDEFVLFKGRFFILRNLPL